MTLLRSKDVDCLAGALPGRGSIMEKKLKLQKTMSGSKQQHAEMTTIAIGGLREVRAILDMCFNLFFSYVI